MSSRAERHYTISMLLLSVCMTFFDLKYLKFISISIPVVCLAHHILSSILPPHLVNPSGISIYFTPLLMNFTLKFLYFYEIYLGNILFISSLISSSSILIRVSTLTSNVSNCRLYAVHAYPVS